MIQNNFFRSIDCSTSHYVTANINVDGIEPLDGWESQSVSTW